MLANDKQAEASSGAADTASASGSNRSHKGGAGTAEAMDADGASSAAPGSVVTSGDDAEATEVDEQAPETTEQTWIQLSTDDSTSMASAQMFKAGFAPFSLKMHEFINYYDPPLGVSEAEPWAALDESVDGISVGVKATMIEASTDTVDDADLLNEPASDTAGDDLSPEEVSGDLFEVLFQMRAARIGRDDRRNWNIFYCVDVSGSMEGDKIGFVKDALHKSLTHLKAGDVVTLVTFDSDVHDVFVGLEWSANADTIAAAIDGLSAGSATNMIAGLTRVYELAQERFDTSMLQRVLLFGDGNANVGQTDLEAFSGLTRINGQEGIYLSGIGVGMDYDWRRFDDLTDAGKGAHVFLPNSEEVELIFGDYFTKLMEVAADQIAIEAMLPVGVHLDGFSGEEVSTNPEERLQNIVIASGDDLTFLAGFRITREAALSESAELTVTLRPLSTAEPVTMVFEFAALSELIAEPGSLLERTRIVRDFASVATSGGTVGAQGVLDAVNIYESADSGLIEIKSLLEAIIAGEHSIQDSRH